MRYGLAPVAHLLLRMLLTDLLQSVVCVLNRVMKRGGGQQLLVRCYGGHDSHGLKRVYYVGESLASAFCAGMGFYRELYGAVKKCGV